MATITWTDWPTVQNFYQGANPNGDKYNLNGWAGNDSLTAGNLDDTIDGGTGNDTLYGLDGSDNLIGWDDNDSLIGGGGIDNLYGGKGNDVYVINAGDESDFLSENFNEGSDTVEASITYSLAGRVYIEALKLMGSAAINGTGNDEANTITGNSAANRLEGGLGVDTLIGGDGGDTYVITAFDTSDVINESGASGRDLVETANGIDLTSATGLANIEDVTLTGVFSAINATGNALGNVLTGNSGMNRLSGGGGTDTLKGGDGNDTYVIGTGDSSDVIQELGSGRDLVESAITFTLTDNVGLALVEDITLTGTSVIHANGNSQNNILTGNGSTNILTGNAGADTLKGGGGIDTLRGGNDGDTYVITVNDGSDVIEETGTGGRDTIESELSYVLTDTAGTLALIEDISLTGTGAINATGNSQANILWGNVSANRLSGGAGIDTLLGGDGGDTYVITANDGEDIIMELGTTGTDTIESALTVVLNESSNLAGIENILLTGTGATDAYGNQQANQITGNDAANTITAGAGNDVIIANGGDDVISGEDGNDTINAGTGTNFALGGAGNDSLIGGVDYDIFYGEEDNDTLTGNGGTDELYGGAGTDSLQGNDGNDTLYGDDGNDTLQGGADADQLFGGAHNDRLEGGLGADHYWFDGDFGVDRIVENDPSPVTDVVHFGAVDMSALPLDPNDTPVNPNAAFSTADVLWFKQVGNDLVVSVVGTTNSLTVEGWYTSAAQKIERFVDDQSGRAMTFTQVNNMVTAMASFTPQAITASSPVALRNALTTNWTL